MLFAALAGAGGVLAFAPFGWWPLQFLSLAFLFYQIGLDTSVKRSALIGWAYGFGWSVAGIHWLYIAMNRFGGMPGILAAIAVCLMGAYFGLYSALFAACATWLRRRWSLPFASFALLVLPAAWGVSEWLRGWVFTGFPWVVSGYAHNASPLAGFAPLVGVYGLGMLAAFVSGAVLMLTQRARWLAATLALALLATGFGLCTINWTHPIGKPISVRLLQGNIDQGEKFSASHIDATLSLYHDMITAAPADLIVTPETAIVVFPQQLPPDYLPSLASFAAQSGSYLMLGVPLADSAPGKPLQYANSAIGLAPNGTAPPYRYDKHHLVPFGEFVPFGFRWFVNLMHIPLGDFERGAVLQTPFPVKDQTVLPNICYEDLFGEEIAAQLHSRPASILLNVSNLAWYGESVAIAQHLQISQMRSLETGRPMLRSTNTGATAAIDAKGVANVRLEPYTRGTLATAVQGMAGSTPYIACGNALFLALAALALLAAKISGRKHGGNVAKTT